MATTQILTLTTAAEAIRKGYNEISMTNWTSATLKPLIAIGSTFELGGSVYQTAAADQDTDPAAAWAGLAAGLVYLYATAAGGPPATVTFSVSVTAPTWDTDKQGYYNGAARCLGQYVKDAGANWTQKTIYKTRQYGLSYIGINIGIGANANRNVRFASDREMVWEETNDRLVMGFNVYIQKLDYAIFGATTDGNIYSALNAILITTGDKIVITGAAVLSASGDTIIFTTATKGAATITLYYQNITTGVGGSLVLNSGGVATPFNSGRIGY